MSVAAEETGVDVLVVVLVVIVGVGVTVEVFIGAPSVLVERDSTALIA